jgi:gliding motility-associated-like protein
MKIVLSNILVLVLVLVLVLFIFPQNTFSQASCTSPAPPVLTLVSVQPQTGFTDLEWTKSTSTDVAAYLIYIFHNENGIPRGDIIDTILDQSVTKYTYKSTVSSYYSVSFVLSSFRVPNCTSPFSNIINTIFAGATIDTCAKRIRISWNSYPQVPKKVLSYTILTSINGGAFTEAANAGSDKNSFTLNEFVNNAQYCFVVKANIEDGTYSTSNKVCVSTKMQRPPDWINADYATVNEKNTINVSFTIDPLSKINMYRFERKTENESNFTLISQIESVERHIIFSDKSADPAKKNYYRLQAVNNCGNPIVTSNLSNNIVVRLIADRNMINLRWTPFNNWLGENSGYKVFIDSGDGFREETSLPSTDTIYSVSYSSVMYKVTAEKLCFCLGAYERKNPYGISGGTLSSRVCTDIIEQITVPNAFTPNNDLKNDTFKPSLSFKPVEYHIVITDRGNRVLFESRDYNEEWDGKMKGNSLPEGLYLWYLSIKSPSGKVIKKTGTVTIIK